ncbi:hypothetical protein DRN86_00540 [Candidatus Geothermarchaeota archaeon]|nr:MAG: hypothetical protein DRN86_00540 [Candidatus Geothermarchaeota archaeon]
MGFLIATENPNQLIRFILAVSKITDEIRLQISPEKVWFRGMDSAHVSMIDFEISKKLFSEYQVDKEQTVSVLLEKVIKFLKGVKKNEKLELAMDETTGRLKIRAIGRYSREFITPLLDVGETRTLGTPKVEFPVKIKMACSVLEHALDNIKQISDKVKFEALLNELKIKGESDEGYETVISVDYDSPEVYEKEIKKESMATYNVEIMTGVVKELSKISELVSLNFGTDLPLKLAFEMLEGMKFDFYLAPRIE